MVAVEGVADPVVGSDAPVLNRFGLQVGRRLASKARQRMTRWPIPLELDSPLTGLRTEGCALLPRMFSPDTLAEITEVADRVSRAGDRPHFVEETSANQTEGTRREDLGDEDREVLDRFWLHPTVLALLSAAERRHLEPDGLRCTIQRVVDLEGGDRAPVIQSDVAHPTHAMWLFLSDVFEADGPLVYYPGSQRLRPRQLREVYAESLSGAEARIVTEDELARRKLEPKVFHCARGSAVLANTFGYHGWFPGEPSGDRLVLHVEVARRGRTDTAPADLEPADVEAVDLEPVEAVDADPALGEPSAQEPADGELIAAEAVDAEPIEAEAVEADMVEADVVETEVIEAELDGSEEPDEEPVPEPRADDDVEAALVEDPPEDETPPDELDAKPAAPVQVTLFDQDQDQDEPVEADLFDEELLARVPAGAADDPEPSARDAGEDD